MTSRYAPHGPDGDFQPGSRRRVLTNHLDIFRVRDMQVAESEALLSLTHALLLEVHEQQTFNAQTLQTWHRRWLGGIYPWAGQYRQVNLSKSGFLFAAAHRLEALMTAYSRDVLAVHTPCARMDEIRLAQALAATHAEFILIHPFRDGNGRLARLLNTMMALQAGFPALDYGGIQGRGKRDYIAAIHAALGRDYAPLELSFGKILRRTLRG
jgi:cell filamentation protein